jgi:hypothetical protein
MTNPYYMDNIGELRGTIKNPLIASQVVKNLISDGYDSIIIRSYQGGPDYIVFSPEQIHIIDGQQEASQQAAQDNQDRVTYAQAIRGKMEEWLGELGIAVGVLSELDEANGVTGEFDPTVEKKNAEGLIEMVKVAKDQRGDVALTEEFAHFIHAAMKDDVLMQRLTGMLEQYPELINLGFSIGLTVAAL